MFIIMIIRLVANEMIKDPKYLSYKMGVQKGAGVCGFYDSVSTGIPGCCEFRYKNRLIHCHMALSSDFLV